MSIAPTSSLRSTDTAAILGQVYNPSPSSRTGDASSSTEYIDEYLTTVGQSYDATSGGANAGVAPDTPGRADALSTAATELAERDFDAANAAIKKVLEKNPTDVAALRLSGSVAAAGEDYKTAERQLAKAAALSPDDVFIASDLRAARILQKSDAVVLTRAKGMLGAAATQSEGLRLLASLAARSPENGDAKIALAQGYVDARRPELAVSALDDALTVADDTQLTRIVDQVGTIARKHSGSAFAKDVFGRSLVQSGELNRGIAELRAAADLAPYNATFATDLSSAYVARAKSSVDRGATEAAKTDLAAAYAVDQFNPQVKTLTAQLATADARDAVFRGHYDKALIELATARRNAPDDASVRVELAKLYNQVGEHFEATGGTTQALADFTAAIDLDPQNVEAKQKVAELSHQKGIAALSAGDYDRAIGFLQTAFDTYRPDSTYQSDLAKALDQRGELSRIRGKYTDAITDLTRAVQLDSTNSAYGTHLALAVQSNGI